MKISEGFFYLKFFQFLEVKFSIYLNRRVFVMVNTILAFSVTGALRVNLTLWQCNAMQPNLHTYVYDLVLQECVGFPSNMQGRIQDDF